eukprot:gene14541-20581_t
MQVNADVVHHAEKKGLLTRFISPRPANVGSRPPRAAEGSPRSSLPGAHMVTHMANVSCQGAARDDTATEAQEQDPGSSLLWQNPDLGLPRNMSEKYEVGDQIGKGGNGVVRIVTERTTGLQYACKSTVKVLGKGFSDLKCRTHIASLKREIEVLTRLRGCLNIVELHEVFEDEDHVHIVQEYCQGGEVNQRMATQHYSERTVASYIRAALRTLAVMHSHHILHRDIKPENFMFLNNSSNSPLKAIDFGLAMPYDPDELPRTELGLEGTPWYMAPECLSSRVVPASDLWSVGVMAYQLLTGRLPFDDHKRPSNPAIATIWRSILIDDVNTSGPMWADISPEAKSFVISLLNRNPNKRPTAKSALKDPWLKGDVRDRSNGNKLARSVVQRIQRFTQASHFKRFVLETITADMLQKAEQRAECEAHHGGADGLAQHEFADGLAYLDAEGVTQLEGAEGLAQGEDTDGVAQDEGAEGEAHVTQYEVAEGKAQHENAQTCVPEDTPALAAASLEKLMETLHMEEVGTSERVALEDTLKEIGT